MGLYEEYFDQSSRELPYSSEEHLTEDLLRMIDAYALAAFMLRESSEERLDMRGLVITHAEYLSALEERNLAYKEYYGNGEGQLKRREAYEQLNQIKEHIKSRWDCSGTLRDSFSLPRVLTVSSLSGLEQFGFLLALALEYDRKYERIYGYLQDNVALKQPTVGLALSLYGLGARQTAEESFEWIGPDSCLWKGCLKENSAEPSPGSGLSRVMAVRTSLLSYLRCRCWNWNNGELKAVLIPGTDTKEPVIDVFLGEFDYQDKEERKELMDLLHEAAFAARVEGVRICLKQADELEGNLKVSRSIIRFMNSTALPYEFDPPAMNKALGPCAVYVKKTYTWEDLILEDSEKKLLHDICDQVKYRRVVREEWGFGKKNPYGSGVSAIFYGAPGTGKTMAAQVLARELGLELYKVDLSQLVSKYIGETEKNLSALFDKARDTDAVLFFDEADSLFAKRSEVGNSNDRYANMETGFLLQKLEEYEGVTVLATNFVNNIDEAFKRRIKFLVRFTFPSADVRLKLWKSMLPMETPMEEPLDFEALAEKYELSGSSIKEVLTNAAFLAAGQGRGLHNQAIRSALQTHLSKFGRNLRL